MSETLVCEECGAVILGRDQNVEDVPFNGMYDGEGVRLERIVTGRRWLPCGHGGRAIQRPTT